VDAAEREGIKKPTLKAVIANPHEEIIKLVQRSASRWRTVGDYAWRK